MQMQRTWPGFPIQPNIALASTAISIDNGGVGLLKGWRVRGGGIIAVRGGGREVQFDQP